MALKHIGNRANGTTGLSEAERQAYVLQPHIITHTLPPCQPHIHTCVHICSHTHTHTLPPSLSV
jgi:hypothetical protein